MHTLLLNGDWLLKKHHFQRLSIVNKKQQLKCGGLVGFFITLNHLIHFYRPNKVVVAWDGIKAGHKKYDFYPPWALLKKQSSERILELISGGDIEPKDSKEENLLDIVRQKIKTQHLLENCYVRQLETEESEADDLIAGYVEGAKEKENIVIYSRPYEFLQLISSRTCLAYPDKKIITLENCTKRTNTHIDNELLIRCFIGSANGFVEGVKGISRNKLLKYFPVLSQEKTSFSQLCEMAESEKQTRKIKFFDLILESTDTWFRNEQVLDLKNPWLSQEDTRAIYAGLYLPLSVDRDISETAEYFHVDGYAEHINGSVNDFFSVFYSLMVKEREFRKIYNMIEI